MAIRPSQPRPTKHAAALTFLAAIALGCGPAAAEGIHGRVNVMGAAGFTPGYSFNAFLGQQNNTMVIGDARLQIADTVGDFDFAFDYEITGSYGTGVSLARSRTAALGITPPPETLFDLTGTLTDHGNVLATQRIDRLSVGYTAPDFVFRVGRQALTWGEGRVFHPMDLVDPFAPGTYDTEFKPGVDMIYGQYLFSSGADLQAIVVPRRATAGGAITTAASTFAAQFHTNFGEIGTTLMLARDHGQTTAGLGLSGPLGGANWNAELVPTFTGGTTYWSGLINVSGATTLGAHNFTWFGEYYHNGFGTSATGTPLAALPAVLTDRLVRGQVFTTSRDYLAAGGMLEVTPLFTVSPSVIFNANDRSAYVTAEADYSLSDNATLYAGGALPVGPKGTEFGGLPLTAGSTVYDVPERRIYAGVRYHF